MMPLTHFPHTKHLNKVTYGKLVVLPGAVGCHGVLPGCCAGRVLPGVAGLLGTYQHILTAGLGCQSAELPGSGLKANPANPANPAN